MKKVSAPEVVMTLEAPESPLPPQIQEALGELVGAAKEGLLALSVGVGLSVVHELMELDVDEVVGPKGKWNPDRVAVRHGHENGSMTLGGRRVQVSRPRMRTSDDEHELPVQTYQYFADRDPLTRVVMDRVLAGVSARRFAGVGEPVGGEVEQSSSATGKTAVSDMFIARTRTALSELMSRRLEDVRLAVMMLDGIEIAERTHVVALGISTEGVKIPLGLWEGSTENATLARVLLADLVDRGLDPEQAILFVIDGGKALRRAIRDVFGEHALVHRCHRHKERNVTDLLPERDRPVIRARMRAAWALSDPELARQRLQLLASELERSWPDAAASLREGMEYTLTLKCSCNAGCRCSPMTRAPGRAVSSATVRPSALCQGISRTTACSPVTGFSQTLRVRSAEGQREQNDPDATRANRNHPAACGFMRRRSAGW